MAEIALRKSIIVSKYPNQYPACWVHVSDEQTEKIEGPKQQSFDIEATTLLMEHTHKLTSIKNNNSEDDDWELKVLKFGWTQKQTKLYNKVVRILDYDRLSRLSCIGENKRQEILQVRMTIDKSAGRMRKALASVEWEVSVIQWLHTILMENLPATYLAYYLDIMQTLKSIVPSLVDKMIFWKPGNINQDLLASVLKKPWQPTLVHMYRKLQGNALIVVIPPLPRVSSTQPPRIQRLFSLFTTMSPILPIQLNTVTSLNQQSLQSWAEQTISITRSKIQELKNENPDRRLLLIGMHSSSSIALQVALVEQVSGVVCFGFSYNTVHGSRGLPDDHLLKLNCPILFMIGQNSVRSSEEELEIIREKLNQNSLLQTITVGGADDFLRISKKKRKFEGLTQEMVDNLIVDEIADYASKCVQRPIVQSKQSDNGGLNRLVDSSTSQVVRKRKNSLDEFEMPKITKVSKIKNPSINSSSSEITERAVQSIIADLNESAKSEKPFVIQRGETTLKPVKKVFSNSPFYSNNQGKKFVVDVKATPIQQISTTVPRQIARSIGFNSQMNQTSVLNARGKFVPLVHHQKLTNFSPPKFTIVRSSAPSSTSPNQSYLIDNADPDDASILNMPIVFADNEGNLVGNSSSTTIRKDLPASDSTGNMNKIIFRTTQKNLATKQITPIINSASIQNQMPTVTITKNKNILIQKPTQTPKNFLVLNGLVGRPVSASNIIIPQHQNLSTGQMIKIPQKHVISPSTSSHPTIREVAGKKIEIIDNTVIKPASQLAQSKNISFVNLAESKTFPNKISISNSTIKKGQLVVKTSSLKPITLSGTKQFGNITVNKFSTPSNVIAKAKGKPNPNNKPPTA